MTNEIAYDGQGLTLLDDKAGFGLTKTLNILANTKDFAHNPIEKSMVIYIPTIIVFIILQRLWEQSCEKNLEGQCIPHSILLAVRRFSYIYFFHYEERYADVICKNYFFFV